MIADHLAVQGQRLRQQAGPGLQPPAEQLGEGRGIEPGEHLVKHRVAGHLIESLGARLARQAELVTLGRGEGRGKACDLGDVTTTGQERHRD